MSTSSSSNGTISRKINSLLSTRKPWFARAIRYIWIALLVFLLGLPATILMVRYNFLGAFGEMPSLADVENPENDLSSELISADGVSLGRYFRFNRSQVTYDQLSPDLINTLVLSEDHRFQEHSGLDFQAFLRVIYGISTLNLQGGGSTITQQLAKNLYTRNPDRALDGWIANLGSYPRRAVQKVKEWMISIDLERNFTKEEIIAMYFNTTEFSSNSYGIKVGTETYFGKQPDSVNLQEAAVLVGMLQNPSWYNPQRHPDRALKKRNEVLAKVYRHKYKITTRAEFDSITALPLELKFKVQNQNEGLATYFRTVIGNFLLDYCKSKGIDLYNSGLKIYTTIDSRLQRYAEEAMNDHMKGLQKEFYDQWKARGINPWVDDDSKMEIRGYLKAKIKQTDAYKNLVERYGAGHDSINIMLNLKKPMTIFTWGGERDTLFSSMDSLNYYKRFLQSGFMAMDPNTGYIKAWVGGFNHKYFKFDHVKQGKRQPGSTFKPFVYGLAMESGYSPCYKLKDYAPSFKVPGGNWSPKNFDGTYGNGSEMTLRQAMARSVNSITAQMMQELGAQNVTEFANRIGIESTLDAVPSLCLGTSDVSLYELVGAYSTFVNNGIYTRPMYITRIEDKNGNVIENFIPKTRQGTDEQTAYKMLYMLQGGVQEEGGTSLGLPMEIKEDNDVGGKTGTTNNASDGWYMGVTHDLVAGVWVGGDERVIHFPSWSFGSGARSARPIWANFMLKAYADPSSGIVKGRFKRPSTGIDFSFDCRNYQNPDSLSTEE
ncbi:MAG: transglycosylase domain-containing protein, partial [Cyclobacteriaceae bacterium]|nr:transglycosylase domain-containing protein [Cyclobacteriaceae bacterium]